MAATDGPTNPSTTDSTMQLTPLHRLPLRQFLWHSRQLLQSSLAASQPLHFVTGNESADLDSFASSLLYAYLSSPPLPSPSSPSFPPSTPSSNNAPPAPQPPQPIPLLAIPRADLALRPEFHYLLSQLHIPPTSLIFHDDIPPGILTGPRPPNSNSPPVSVTLTLVDHNVLQTSLFAPDRTHVAGVIDHHKDEGKYPHANPRVVEESGSCASLVVGWGVQGGKWGGSDGEGQATGQEEGIKEAAKLALAAILIDTSNMTTRVTPHDLAAVSLLEAKLRHQSPPWDSTAFYHALSTAKSSLDGLSLTDILRKDYKSWPTLPPPSPSLTIGISSVVQPLSYLLSPARGGPRATTLLSTLHGFAIERGLDVVALMTAYPHPRSGVFTRELLVWEVSERAVEAGFLGRFEKWAGGEGGLGLGEYPGGDEDGDEDGKGGLGDEEGRRKVWLQGNTGASRKQVAPGMRGCLGGAE